MIEVKHLTKRYGHFLALEDVSFQIGEGEIVGLLGPNGAGKSTVMNILTGCLSASEGEVRVAGVDVREHPTEAKKSVGYLPEQPPLYPDMTVGEYLRFVYDLKQVDLPREPHLKEICELVKLGDVEHRLIGHLSKGYRQRVGIAAALIGDPKLVIFDEPTVGLDPKQIIEVRHLLRTLAKRHTVLLSTHILAEAKAVCQRVLILNHGQLIADEATDALARKVEENTHFQYSIIGPEKDVVKLLRGVSGVKDVISTGERDGEAWVYALSGVAGQDCRKAVYYALAKQGYPIIAAGAVGADLESIFIRLVDNATSKQ
ncbi:MAG: ABC transporter ATP-binding protein [Clostridia bacterium]|nr:ABC transporter ATP-binding protein [Clostridia bacterium]